MELEATHLRGSCFAVRPKNQLGTCGFHPKPWTVIYVNGRNSEDAIKKAKIKVRRLRRNWYRDGY